MSTITGSNLNFVNSVGSAAVEAERNLNGFMASMDPNNASDLIKAQSLSEQWSLSMTLETGMIKLLYDALKGVSQKIS
ncbi:hypothetical protein EOA60_22005 [Mesorhizobium sp. M1A.F.Ca.IN.020.06.1.1]|uniref:EscF/YscF/HrpA family type III secretion system needle major subunit n=1 Tax=unclassified Mesorhizobium TaxID=325217 RepID=UPI000FCB706A|nr:MULTISPECIES: EscF/YscF/HrpA family type III secretion system needle major subunit [unclassified Mesorhizobium]RUV82103.1 hypothetical protein EOA51_29500 [Mesorhizobium sp. M1A.F.Ca.IN.020.32.1.1]RUW05710.1 hypothetical protein EOA46_27870 [Mesorhizobium sp. M1A.F.Ca.IN.022.05.2.1]RUW23317.1 hypothetical protein EOA60_22005 [Mesorhizobium sp. M1A.F.Ca.IN.020.06.1.1]RWF82302.1 MAG: hypothetical protein EOQ35_10630 [Mesorhizobium sp.]RWG04301.1 MAG: hypothetical protein EOQ38_06395 [Mesorhiz